MGLNETPTSNRIHIGFFGRRNAGKSSLVNAVTSQELAVVSDVAGTTTDPVYKSMELLPLGPVVIIDTAGIDDIGELGELRINKTKQVINKTDIAVLVVDSTQGLQDYDKNLINLFESKNINYIIAYSKCELIDTPNKLSSNEIYVSSEKNINIDELKDKIATMKPSGSDKKMVADFISSGNVVMFVTPIDESAPKGRLILPQQQAIRDVLDSNGISVVVQPDEVTEALNKITPDLVVTDSQVFGKVNKLIPHEIMLTSFSILVARVKGLLDSAVEGAASISSLKDGDTVLISEGCTHHRQCNDIGTVKMPSWIENYCKKKLNFEFTSGGTFPDNLGKYALIVHCGGCMINEREVRYRMKCAANQGIPVSNYGIAIAYMKGILDRSTEIIYNLV